MADLVTHLCTALLPGAFHRGRGLGAVVLGTALPDLVARVIPLGLQTCDDVGLVDVPEAVMFPWGVLHEPFALALLCVLASTVVVERDRALFFRGLLLGCALHLGVDLLQDHHGQGYYLLAPFALGRFELGLIGSEATVDLALPLAGITAAAWAWRLVSDRRRRAVG